MKHSFQCKDREKVVADALWPVASELRLIEVADLISMLRFERHADLSDVVASAAELFYLPDTIKLGIGGDYRLDWAGDPQVVFDLEIRVTGVTLYVRLTLENYKAGVEIDHIVFENPSEDQAENTAFLADALVMAAYRPLPEAITANISYST